MVTTIRPLDPITFSRNQHTLRVRVTDDNGNPYRAYGSQVFIEVSALSDSLSAGNTITFSYTDPESSAPVSITFLAGAPIGDERLPIQTGIATGAHVLEVFDVITRHPLISPIFTHTISTLSGAHLLILEARDRSVDFAPAVTYAGTSGWSSPTTLLPINTNAPDNFGCIFDVYFERHYLSGSWERVSRLLVPPDDNGYATIDVESILTQEWNNARYRRANEMQPLVPDVQSADPFIADNLRRYYVRYGERHGSPAEVMGWTITDRVLALDGGVTKRKWAEGNYLLDLSANESLASWRPRQERTVSPLQPAFLSWHNSQFGGAVILKVTPQFIDGTWGNTATVSTMQVGLYQTVTFAVGANQLNIDTATTGRYKVEIFLADETTASVMDTVYYTLDCHYYRGLRFLLWRNSWGVAEELRCTGHYTLQSDVERNKARMVLPLDYNVHTQERVQYNETELRATTYRTGYLRLEEQLALMDMFKIGDVWEVLPGGQLCALDLMSNNFRVYDTRNQLHALEFEATPRLMVHNHAPGVGSDIFTTTNNESAQKGPWVDQMGAGAGNWIDHGADPWMYGG